VRIVLATLTGGAQERAEQLFALAHDDAEPEAFTVDISKAHRGIKSNAFPTEPPSEVQAHSAAVGLPVRYRDGGRQGALDSRVNDVSLCQSWHLWSPSGCCVREF
jgi:hypothetical protein